MANQTYKRGDDILLNNGTVWTIESISQAYDNGEVVLVDMYQNTFKLRKSGKYMNTAKGALYPMSDSTAVALYQAYRASLEAKATEAAAKAQVRDSRRAINYARQRRVDDLNKDERVSTSSLSTTDDTVWATAAVRNEYIWSDTSEFYPRPVIALKIGGTKEGNGGSNSTLTLEAAERLVQLLADAVIEARTNILPKVEALKKEFDEDDKNPKYLAPAKPQDTWVD